VTIRKPSAVAVARVCTTGYSMGIGGRELPPPLPAMTAFTATTDQQLKAEMALRFKAIKLGATATQVNLWTLNEVFIFISNHA